VRSWFARIARLVKLRWHFEHTNRGSDAPDSADNVAFGGKARHEGTGVDAGDSFDGRSWMAYESTFRGRPGSSDEYV
jgi:hypothetical protein